MYQVYMLSWDDIGGKKLLSVAKTQEHADDLVDEYSEQFPHAYIDWERMILPINSDEDHPYLSI